MVQKTELSISLFASGYCQAHERIVDPLNGKGRCKFHAVWALIFAPKIGYILFDTGYSNEFNKATKTFPERFYRWATPVYLNEQYTVKNTLHAKGIFPDDIKYIILSHFHADHIAGLKDFPNTPIICSKKAHDEVKNIHGIKAISKGILHNLLPVNYERNLLFIEDIADKRFVNQYGLEEFYLLGLNEFKLVSLPGHARGMLGFIYHSSTEHILFATDASWRYDTYKQNVLPKKVVKLFFDSWDDFVDTLQKIRCYELDNENVKILFTHCPKTLLLTHHAF